MRNKLRTNIFKVALALVCGAFVAQAQQASSNMGVDYMSGVAGTYAIRNAHIVTVSGADIENGTVVVSNGHITAVGANVAVPAGAKTIEGRGLSVYPGMIDLGTSMGLIEITENGATGWIDTQETGEMNPNAQAYYGINPHSAHVGVTRVNGITSVLSLPQGGIISGQAAFINLLGSSPKEMAVLPQAALVVNFPRTPGGGGFGGFFAQQANPAEANATRDRQIESLRKMLRDAEAYGRAVDAAGRDKSVPRPDTDLVLASLVPYVRGERAVIFRADRDAEMRAVVRFAEEMKLKPVILGGDEAWKAATFLKEHNVPVILTGIWNLPNLEDDFYDVEYENAAKLQQAGVRFCISTGDVAANVRDLPYQAGMSAAFGLPKADALKAVTLYPAQIMGVADQLGTIEVGKVANLVVADGDILEPRTNIRHLFINGRQVPLVSRHTELYEMFRNRK
ncbi:MAG TPA: amidohydrolase family protein [Pyrinomonadaceae bacterium]|nr:amidohydrolase family protein [Pyrinomonadaceae bacterium]